LLRPGRLREKNFHKEFCTKIAVPDLIYNSYFAAIAAAELGLFKQEGLDPRMS
jgi:hypothetical protein